MLVTPLVLAKRMNVEVLLYLKVSLVAIGIIIHHGWVVMVKVIKQLVQMKDMVVHIAIVVVDLV